jgi:hypothetical protein
VSSGITEQMAGHPEGDPHRRLVAHMWKAEPQ